MTEREDFPKYDSELDKCRDFLKEFQKFGEGCKYMDLLQEVANRRRTVVEIELEDVLAHKREDDFVERIGRNTHRYLKLFCRAIDEVMPDATEDISARRDVWDVLCAQRLEQHEQALNQPDAELEGADKTGFPPALTRRYECRILPLKGAEHKPVALRDVRADDVGRLVQIRAMVTRVSDVKPLAAVVTYTCDTCGAEVYQEVFNRQYTPLHTCPSNMCVENHVKGKLVMQTRGSRFLKYQELRIQELPDQVPIGHVPRTMTVQCHGELTRCCGPGDIITLAGIFLPIRYEGFKAMKAGLIADIYVEVQHIFRHKKNYDEFEDTPELAQRLSEAADDPNIFRLLARSIAPEIYGHEDVKKALLLQLVGGVTRTLPDGMKIRGDINICLMGDPGVAKSQLLKYIASVAPRGVYTTGKGSSGVGLTAAVSRDPVTGDMALEGGALVLADHGICCIDEFDKMEESDRTAIHEVMEQQTVSIAKAGITTTLNARAAVLAAANPLYGRYNRNRPMSENINLPNSLISRFDLIFLLLDRADMETDTALARHVTYVHQHGANPELDFVPLDPTFIKHYISQARTVEPYIPAELAPYVVEAYVELRQADAEGPSDQTAMTARQLLSILRLSQALARLKFYEAVTTDEVEEAIRLTHISKASLANESDGAGGMQSGAATEDVTSRIYGLIRDTAAAAGVLEVEYQRIEAMAVRRGFSEEQIAAALEEYVGLELLEVNAARTHIAITVQKVGEDEDEAADDDAGDGDNDGGDGSGGGRRVRPWRRR
ncbi:minichromosome maintenance protein [Tribonema minus]|uniref:DNA replication licensing factor MCM7 n=1 Tax=Tribonema minus TaxID=303371 RepID=A0A835YVG8_9STRA|nr:minichromosome maintenance protein [Tribonema minus]